MSNQPLYDIAVFLTFLAPWWIFGISVVVSVVLLVRRRFAFYVPLIAGALMIVCAVIGYILDRLY